MSSPVGQDKLPPMLPHYFLGVRLRHGLLKPFGIDTVRPGLAVGMHKVKPEGENLKSAFLTLLGEELFVDCSLFIPIQW